MEESKVMNLKREEDSTKAFLSQCDIYACGDDNLTTDLEFICKDGCVSAHQLILASHSQFIRQILNRFQDLEFSVADWSSGQMFLLDRRRGTEVVHVSLPDVETKHVRMMIDLFHRGVISLGNSDEAAGLKDVWRLLKIESVRLESLDVISEVTISGGHDDFQPFSADEVNTHENLLTTIKTEIIDEVDQLAELKSGLEAECEICKDRFEDEADLLRHMEHSHNDNKSMYDRVKYKRAKTDDEGEKHPKDKGKGKGKGKGKSKTIEPKLLRKDIVLPAPKIHVPENKKTPPEVPSPPTETEDNSSSQPMSEEKLDESSNESNTVVEISLEKPEEVKTPIKKDKKGGKRTKNKVTLEMVRKTDEIFNEKRAFESINSEEPATKKLKVSDSEKPKMVKEKEPDEDEKEEERSWDDIQCLVCDQDVPIFLEKPGQNRRKYQTHLLTHFYDTQYSEIPEGLRVYQCSYRDCSYAGANRNPYLQHIAFKHDEWYRRINKRVDEAMKDPDIGDELEELSAVKEVFLTDYRIIPDHHQSTKPLWIEGKTIGREAEDEEAKEKQRQVEEKMRAEEESKKAEEEKRRKSEEECQKLEEEKRKKDMEEKREEEKEEQRRKEREQEEERERKEEKLKKALNQSEVEEIRLSVDSEPDINVKELPQTVAIPQEVVRNPLRIERKPNTPVEDPTKELRCRLCPKVMRIDPSKVSKNRQSYQMHLMESHFVDTMFNDIPDLQKFYCPYHGCKFPGADTKERFRVHLAFTHKEFSKRINRRITELMGCADPDANVSELQTLRDTKEFFQRDPRVLNEDGSGARNWATGEVLHSTEDMQKAGPPSMGKILTHSTIHNPVKEGQVGTVNVEISADLIQKLKAEEIKEETGVSPNHFSGKVCSQQSAAEPEISLTAASLPSSPEIPAMPQLPQPRSPSPAQVTEPLPPPPVLPPPIRPPSQSLHPTFSPLPESPEAPVLTGLLSPCPESVCLGLDDPPMDPVPPPRESNKEKKDIKAQNLRREKPRQIPLLPAVVTKPQDPKENVTAEKDEDCDIEEIIPTENSNSNSTNSVPTDVNPELMEILDNINILPPRASVESAYTDTQLIVDEDTREGFDLENSFGNEISFLEVVTPEKEPISPVKTPSEPVHIYLDPTTPQKEIVASIEPSLPSIQTSPTGSISSKDKSNLELYTCKVCKKDFVKRPEVIMHIIGEHMQERFPDVPYLIDEKYYCTNSLCSYSSTKRNGLLAHLTLKHLAIKITDVTDLIIHNDEQLHRAVIKSEPRTCSPENIPLDVSPEKMKEDTEKVDVVDLDKVKEEPQEQSPLKPVKISKRDQTSFSWKCKGCQKNFISEDGLRQHIIMTHLISEFDTVAPQGLKIYSCEQCFKYSTVSRNNFIKHMGMQHQVVREEMVGQYVEQSESLLLNIDVITCRCDKQFERQRHLREHIIFNHYKHKFKEIPKGLPKYRCKERSCLFKTHSRVTLIRHLVSSHEAVSEKEIKKFIPAEHDETKSNASSTDDSIIDDDSSIDFDDSVSQVPEKSRPTERRKSSSHSEEVVSLGSEGDQQSGGIPFANNLAHECPVCGKLVAQRSNFEDHLQTHGIEQEPLFQCGECEMVTSFAQLYLHLASVHRRPSNPVKLTCVACEDSCSAATSREGIRWLRTHCTEPTARARHQSSSQKFLGGNRQALHIIYRYSCQLCTMYFKTTEPLAEHGKKFGSRCFQQGGRQDPIYTCHLCDCSKAASQFPSHVAGTQHQHKVRVEASKHRDKYGTGPKDHFYSCERCLMAASLSTTTAHLKQQPKDCLHMMCGPCGLDVEGMESEGLTYYFQQHVLTDQHKDRVQKFRENRRAGNVPPFLLKYRFCCESCSASFSTHSNLTSHSNCPRARFCCVPCNYTSPAGDFDQHLRSMTHAQAVASPITLQSEVSTEIPSTLYQEVEEDEEVVDLSSSPPGTSSPRVTRGPTQFKQPNLPAGISMTAVPSSDVSVMEVNSGRPASPEDSILEVASSVMEVNSDPVPRPRPLARPSPGPSRQGPSRPTRFRGPPGQMQPPRPGMQQRPRPSLTLNSPQPRPPRPQQNGPQVRQGPSSVLYTCLPCKTSFSNSGKFQTHASWHEKEGTWAHLHCRVCRWQIKGERLGQKVTEHLFNIKHTVNIAKRSGAVQ